MPETAAEDFARTLKARREALGWSLSRAAERSGVSKSALSKIENGAMSPTYETLRRLAEGFGVSIATLVSPGDGAPEGETAVDAVAIRRSAVAARIPADPSAYSHQLLAEPGARLSFTPVLTTVHARNLTEYGAWDSHDTADFIYCLSGRVEMLFRDHPSMVLAPGDAIAMDGRAAHAMIRLDETATRVLWISGSRRRDP